MACTALRKSAFMCGARTSANLTQQSLVLTTWPSLRIAVWIALGHLYAIHTWPFPATWPFVWIAGNYIVFLIIDSNNNSIIVMGQMCYINKTFKMLQYSYFNQIQINQINESTSKKSGLFIKMFINDNIFHWDAFLKFNNII